MSEPEWWCIGIEAAAEREDELIDVLAGLGLDALEICGAASLEALRPEPGRVRLKAYVTPEERAPRERELSALEDVVLLEARPISRDGWSDQIPPVRAGSFTLRPAGTTAQQDERVIWLEPGIGFGAGEHPTTRLAIELLEASLKRGDRVLDVGCGTGVLALVALALGAASADAIDVSADALRATRKNAELNGATRLHVLDLPLSALSEDYDLIVANILTPVLLELRAGIQARGQRAILSGILSEDAARVIDAYAGWRLTGRRDEDGWCSLSLER